MKNEIGWVLPIKDAGSSFLKLLAFFKSGFNRCRNENYVK